MIHLPNRLHTPRHLVSFLGPNALKQIQCTSVASGEQIYSHTTKPVSIAFHQGTMHEYVHLKVLRVVCIYSLEQSSRFAFLIRAPWSGARGGALCTVLSRLPHETRMIG